MDKYDVIIIGGGPAGLSAGIYSARESFSTLLLEKSFCGGLVAIANLIENYPGFPEGIEGPELMKRFKQQALKFGVKINEWEEVKGIRPLKKEIVVETSKKEYRSIVIIVACGTTLKKLNIPGEEEFVGKGVSYCASCDGPLYNSKDVAVIGGGNTALSEALFLANFARKVILVHRRNQLRGSKILQKRLQDNEKIQLLLNYVPISINGDKRVTSLTVKEVQTGKKKQVQVSGIFIYVGFSPNSKFLEGIVELDERGFIKTDQLMQTSVEGIYASGDVRAKSVRQIDVACSDATIAAMSAKDYIQNLK